MYITQYTINKANSVKWKNTYLHLGTSQQNPLSGSACDIHAMEQYYLPRSILNHYDSV